MASTYSDLKFELIGTGEQAGTWGVTTNTNIGTAIEQAIAGKADITFSSTTETLSLSNTNALQDARALYLNLGGTPGGAATLEVPAIEKPYIVKNGTGQTVTVKVSGQTGIVVPNGTTAWLYTNGTDVVRASDIDGLVPSQTGNSSKYLTTNGSAVSWATVDIDGLVPSQTGNSGKYLTTNGSAVSWGTVSATGDVVGPASATDNGIALFDGTTGKLLQNSSGQDGLIHGLVIGRGGGSQNANTALGTQSPLGSATSGNYNTAIGSGVFSDASFAGESNTGIGYAAGPDLTTGDENTLVGGATGLGLTTGSNNIAVGRATYCGETGDYNISMGFGAMQNATSGSKNIAIGYLAGRTGSPFNITSESDRIVLGSSTTSNAYIQVAWTVVSDSRDKADVNDCPYGLSFVNNLRPVKYKWDRRSSYEDGIPTGEHKSSKFELGFLAQDIIATEQQTEEANLMIGDDEQADSLKIVETKMIPVLVKAIQELTTRLEAAEAEIAALKG